VLLPYIKKVSSELAFQIQRCYNFEMKKIILASMVLVAVGWSSVALAECPQAYPLFRIERSKNKHIVQYDICVSENGDVSSPEPVRVYWLLENGRRRDLNFIQAMLAYGIDSQEKLGENRYRMALVALKERKIVVEKSPAGYRAIALISGEESILEKAYVKSEERFLGLPKVIYVDLFGRNLRTDVPVTERIIP